MKTIFFTIITLGTFLGSLSAAPCGGNDNIPMPLNYMGIYMQNDRYDAQFYSEFGGYWDLKGRLRENRKDGTYTDSFSGTVSDTTLQGTFTKNDFEWLSDGWFVCMHQWQACSFVSLTISNGKVTGYAIFNPKD